MNNKTPLKFTKKCPPPNELWYIVDNTIKNVSPELGLSVPQIKMHVFYTLLIVPSSIYTDYKMYLTETITEAALIVKNRPRALYTNITNITDLDIKLPLEVIDFLSVYAALDKLFPEHSEVWSRAIEISMDGERILSNLIIKINDSLEPVVVESKEDLETLILRHAVSKTKLPPLQKSKEVPF